MKIFLDETVARIQLVLANEYIWWQIFIFRRLVWLKWEHIYSILHYSSPVLEIKRCKISTEVREMIQGRLLDNRCKDWLQNGIYVPIFKLYQFSSVKYFWLFASVFSKWNSINVTFCSYLFLKSSVWDVNNGKRSFPSRFCFVCHSLYHPQCCFVFLIAWSLKIYILIYWTIILGSDRFSDRQIPFSYSYRPVWLYQLVSLF